MSIDVNDTTWVLVTAPLAGLVVGWALGEVSGARRRQTDRLDRQREATNERVFQVLYAWQNVVDTSASLAIQKDMASLGHPDGQHQVESFGEELNAAQRDLRRLVIEVEVLGPQWFMDPMLGVVDKLSDLNRDLVVLDKPTFTAEKGLALRDKIDEMLRDREALVDLARKHLSGL